jgi:hypothetical protein
MGRFSLKRLFLCVTLLAVATAYVSAAAHFGNSGGIVPELLLIVGAAVAGVAIFILGN